MSKSCIQCAVILMGVSGCGKTTIGEMLAEQLGWEFIESDAYHSERDIQKMSSGIPLTDQDRWPWLHTLNALLADRMRNERSVVLACSALKASYRRVLSQGLDQVLFIYLKGNYALIFNRMRQRQHFMKPDMLKSQFDTLEEPSDALVVDISDTPECIVEKVINWIYPLRSPDLLV